MKNGQPAKGGTDNTDAATRDLLDIGDDDAGDKKDSSDGTLDLMTPDKGKPPEPGADEGAKGDDAKGDGDGKDTGGDDKTDDGKKKEDEGKKDKPYELTVPDGVISDKESLAEFTEWAKAKGLTREVAQEVIDFQVKLAKKSAEGFEAERAAWVTAIKADKDLGGDKFDASLALARKAMKRFASPNLNTLLKATGFGDHPEVFRLMVSIGKAMGEDKFLEGGVGKTSPEDVDTADLLFGDMLKKTGT